MEEDLRLDWKAADREGRGEKRRGTAIVKKESAFWPEYVRPSVCHHGQFIYIAGFLAAILAQVELLPLAPTTVLFFFLFLVRRKRDYQVTCVQMIFFLFFSFLLAIKNQLLCMLKKNQIKLGNKIK